ncbi:MAG: hypothetical protein KDD69_13860, partial [Bdellovibrionales bacterium]|nr:hypothetical protein [Bdellovibrionales bacterium]
DSGPHLRRFSEARSDPTPLFPRPVPYDRRPLGQSSPGGFFAALIKFAEALLHRLRPGHGA